MKRLGPIICAVCRKPVERVECQENPCTLARTFRVYCHGEMEEATLSDLDRAVANRIDGVAFARTRLEVSK